MDVGPRLKHLRKLHGLSQRELAKRAGVTNSTISMIEKNSVSPSISSLKKVLSGIPMSLVEFFDTDDRQDHPQVVYRQDELLDISTADNIHLKLVGKAFGQRALAFMVETYEPQSGTGEEPLEHQGEETGLVIEGRVDITVDDTVYTLNTGDAYYFDSRRPHRFHNPHAERCVVVSATTPANF
ncbi:MAG: cupin domain-containing protein [Natronospirillum sp.]